MTLINRFAHPEANLIHFSPFEKYLITWSRRPLEVPAAQLKNPRFPFTLEDAGNHVCIWETLTGKLMRTFPMVTPPTVDGAAPAPEEKKVFTWPMFKWSADERYFARVHPGVQISVYEAPGMRMLANKSVKIDGVVDFEWCPLGDKEREVDAQRAEALERGEKVGPERENVLAYWVPEIANQPAKVSLMGLPSRTNLRSKNLVNVSDVRWATYSATAWLTDCLR